ncbi:MAG: cell division protein ZapA [Alphaproteobacteria bacterium]
MRTVQAHVYGKDYTLACDDGQEQHLHGLIKQVNGRAGRLEEAVGQLREQDVMMLYTALTLADELYDAAKEIARLKSELEGANRLLAESGDERTEAAEEAFAEHLEQLAARVASLTGKLEAA